MAKQKFGLIAKGAREKAAIVARPTGPAGEKEINPLPEPNPLETSLAANSPISSPQEVGSEPKSGTIRRSHHDKPVPESRNTQERKKKQSQQAGPINAARISKDAHRLLNMINSITGQTHSQIIDELLVKHPLYKTLKPILKIKLE
ncbi:hypothetical protein GCM10027347_50970 [Larkinella harenae]